MRTLFAVPPSPFKKMKKVCLRCFWMFASKKMFWLFRVKYPGNQNGWMRYILDMGIDTSFRRGRALILFLEIPISKVF